MTIGKPLVIDIYYGDQVRDFALTKAFGIVGVIHKASEGKGFVDKLYAVRRKLWLDGGKVPPAPPDGGERSAALAPKWGAYHFFHGGDPRAEADHFLAVAEPDSGTLVALDWEDVPGRGAARAEEARQFLDRIEEKLGRKAVIYSGNVAKEKISGKDGFFGAHRLWLAQYGTRWAVQPSWSAPWLWQNNGDGFGPGPHTIPGIAGRCDNNTIAAGTVADLLASWAA
jgi:GH25 family lysozyme M1 (1,4-beta-N-acetylmuramidase)